MNLLAWTWSVEALMKLDKHYWALVAIAELTGSKLVSDAIENGGLDVRLREDVQ